MRHNLVLETYVLQLMIRCPAIADGCYILCWDYVIQYDLFQGISITESTISMCI